jgi:meso-butanediol dehydrogenase / (S,S)-butanediol dehydrogenase / diacetyl reductase
LGQHVRVNVTLRRLERLNVTFKRNGWAAEEAESVQRFRDRVALVTGGGRGIGRAIAERLGSEGAAVVIADLDRATAEDAAGSVVAAGGTAVGVGCDVTDRGSVDAAMATAVESFGGVDVLVANVGVGSGTSFEDIDDSTWAHDAVPTLHGTVLSIQSALPHLMASPAASVVMIGSVNGLAASGDLVYSTAKAALPVLAQNLSVVYGRRLIAQRTPAANPVRFNVVAPGTIRTRVWDDQPESLAAISSLYPTGRVGSPEDVAAAVAFLASDDAAWVTGVTLPVDGGLLTGPSLAMYNALAGITDPASPR